MFDKISRVDLSGGRDALINFNCFIFRLHIRPSATQWISVIINQTEEIYHKNL